LGGETTDTPRRPRAETSPLRDAPSAAWQTRARALVAEAEARLWSPQGERALAYLREKRGFADETLRGARLGYLPAERREDPARWGLAGEGVWLPRGVVIPCKVLGNLWYVKIRRPAGEPKYVLARGSAPALFGAATVADHDIAVYTEGEFDALLVEQTAGDLVAAVTMGSASLLPTGRWLWGLRRIRRILAAFDTDAAGAKGSARLGALCERVRPARPLGAKDLTDMHLAFGDLRAWVRYQLRRHAEGLP
jgi:hypothetical protein